MNCPKCGPKMDLYEKDTSSGRDMRTYVCRPCDKWVDVDNGIALWQVLHDAREVEEKSKGVRKVAGLGLRAMGEDGDQGSVTLRRALRAPEFWLLLVASVAATAGLAWWVTVPSVVAGLSIVSMPKYVALWPRVREVGAELEWWKTIALSMFNNLACACGVQVVGVFARWLWL